jgi:D-amino-acid dehydrogenase
MPKHILIIGGGVIGLCTAYYARKKGHIVTVIERNGRDRDMASLGNAGMVVPSHFVPLATPANVRFGMRNLLNPESPFYIRPRLDPKLMAWGAKFMQAANAGQIAKAEPVLRDLNLLSRSLYEEIAFERANDFGLQMKGLLMLCKTAEGLREESEFGAHANQLGVPAETLTPEDVAKLDPGITFDIAGAVYFPKDCHLTPHKLIGGIARWLEVSGGTIHYNRRPARWVTANGRVDGVEVRNVDGDSQVLQADEYVIAGGAWSDEVAAGLGVSLPLQGGKGYSMTLPKPRQLPAICSILVEARVAVTPMGSTLRVGGTMEIAGLDETVNPRRVQGIIRSACRYYTALAPQDFDGLPVWCGLRPVSPDGMPYVGRLKRYANVSVAAGHAMLGLSLAPVTGLLMSEVLSGEPPSLDMTLLAPDRF